MRKDATKGFEATIFHPIAILIEGKCLMFVVRDDLRVPNNVRFIPESVVKWDENGNFTIPTEWHGSA